jgi:hypothetical protein
MNQVRDTRFAQWRKSSRSQANNNSCVEVGHSADFIGVRDTKARVAGQLAFPATAWTDFVHSLNGQPGSGR